jgi:hypothetical protein
MVYTDTLKAISMAHVYNASTWDTEFGRTAVQV